MPDVELIVGSQRFSGWKGIAVVRSIEQIAGVYELQVSDTAPDGTTSKRIVPGAKAALSLDGETIITGYIDDVEMAHRGNERSIAVRGRDAAGDLVDCSAVYKTGQWSNQSMLAIARDLAAPFGITVSADVDVGKPFVVWNVEPGETVFENIDRMARHRGVLVVSDGQGGIALTRAGAVRAPTNLVLGENILTGSNSISHRERFSEYRVVGQRPRDDSSDGEQLTEMQGRSVDAAVKRYRPRVEVIEDVGDTEALARRALWRRNVQAGRSARAQITVQGWRHESGLWAPNTLVTVRNEWLRLSAELLIVEARYLLDLTGTRTELTVTIPAALTPEELPEADAGGDA